MASSIRHITVDCQNPYALARFWAAVTGYADNPDDRNFPDDAEAMLMAPEGHPNLLFIRVPGDAKVTKNRVHFDLAPAEGTRDEEVARLTELGASQISDHRQPDGTGWVVMADPEGNEFCVERSTAERSAPPPGPPADPRVSRSG
jgi:Glyoxalase-like domain